MGKFDGYLLASDFDGTLIDDQHGISSANVLAIESFIAQGGRFLGATGRTELNVLPFTAGIGLATPWILYNGAAIYDWQSAAFIYKATLDRQLAEAFVHKIIASLPTINIQVFPGGPFFQVNRGARPDAIAVHEDQHYENRPMHEISQDWLKILFCSDVADELLLVETLLEDDPLRRHVHKTRSGQRYFELTAHGVSKGSALAHLKTVLQPAPRHIVAIGDYLNDIEMLQEADTPAAPESAMAEVRRHARIITASHTQSAIADLVGKLEALCGEGSGLREIAQVDG